MKHLESEPLTQKSKSRQKPKKRLGPGLTSAFLGLILLGSIGYGMTAWWGAPSNDHLTEKEKNELTEQFTQIRSVTLAPILGHDMDTVIDTMHLDPNARRVLKQSLETKAASPDPIKLANVVLWDFATQDNDAVHLSSAGYEIDVPLMTKPTTIVIPIDSSLKIQITGLHDGGGGLTLGIQNGAGKVMLPVMKVGQVLVLPVTL